MFRCLAFVGSFVRLFVFISLAYSCHYRFPLFPLSLPFRSSTNFYHLFFLFLISFLPSILFIYSFISSSFRFYLFSFSFFFVISLIPSFYSLYFLYLPPFLYSLLPLLLSLPLFLSLSFVCFLTTFFLCYFLMYALPILPSFLHSLSFFPHLLFFPSSISLLFPFPSHFPFYHFSYVLFLSLPISLPLSIFTT